MSYYNMGFSKKIKMLNEIEKIYICHYKKLTERKQFIIEQFKKENILNYEFVELFDKDSWDLNEINNKYPQINKTNLTDGQKSLALKHSWIVEDAFKNNYNSVIVFEDDVELCSNFVSKFNFYKKQLPEDWEIGWIGSCFNLRMPEVEGKNVYYSDLGSRCTHAFCLNNLFLKRSYELFKNIDTTSDFYYTKVIQMLKVKNYWFQPPLALQSLNFCSSLNDNENHRWDPKQRG